MTDAEVVFGRVNTLSCTFGKQVSQVIQVLVTRIPHNTARRVSGISGMLRRTYRFSIRASSCIITLSVVECRLASTCRYHPSLSHATQLLASHHTLAYPHGESALYLLLTCAVAMCWTFAGCKEHAQVVDVLWQRINDAGSSQVAHWPIFQGTSRLPKNLVHHGDSSSSTTCRSFLRCERQLHCGCCSQGHRCTVFFSRKIRAGILYPRTVSGYRDGFC